jgi:hypothetical protein
MLRCKVLKTSLTDHQTMNMIVNKQLDSAPNRNEYQEYFLGVKAAGA